jgi:hypothetical protein
MASGALPPGFPPIEIEGEHYWDGGLVSNTPLQWIFESRPRLDTLAFQVDLWSARGALPRNLAEVSTRQKDIQYSSRTRAGTDSFKRIQRLRRAAADLPEKLPDDLRRSPEAALLRNVGDRKVYNIVHLIYRAKNYEGPAKDYEFSRAAALQHQRDAFEGKIPFHHCSTWLDPNIHNVFSSMVTHLRIDNLATASARLLSRRARTRVRRRRLLRGRLIASDLSFSDRADFCRCCWLRGPFPDRSKARHSSRNRRPSPRRDRRSCRHR